MKFAVYSRKSIVTGKGESVENQIEMCRHHILREFSDAVSEDISVFIDEGFSGKNLERPGFKKMMSRIKGREFGYVVVYRLDRISRSVSDFSALLEELNKYDVKFISINEKFDTSTPMGRAMISIAAVFAQLERETIAERVRDNMHELSKTGRWLGGKPPLGYKSVADEESRAVGKEPAYRLDFDENIDTVKLIYSVFLETHSLAGVSKRLAQQGIKSPSSKSGLFNRNSVKEILTNPVYCIADAASRGYFLEKKSTVCFEEEQCGGKRGLTAYNKRDYSASEGAGYRLNPPEYWIISIGKHEGIISGEKWCAVQKLLEKNKEERREHNPTALFSGVLRCTRCGSRMFAKPRSGREGAFDYICRSKMLGGKSVCDCPNLVGLKADREIVGYVLDFAKSSSLTEDGVQIADKRYDEKAADAVTILEGQLKKVNEGIDTLVSQLASPALSKMLLTAIDDKVNELSREKERIEESLSLKRAELAGSERARQDREEYVSVLRSFEKTFETASVIEKREALRCLIEKIEWDGDELRVFMCNE